MKTLEKVLAIILFIVGGLGLIIAFGLAALSDYQFLMVALVTLFAIIGIVCLLYGYVRRANLRQTVVDSNDRNSPPGQFLIIGWSMIAVSIILLGAKLFWLH